MSDFKQIGQIIEGHFNKYLDKANLLSSDTKNLSELRFADCLLCDLTPPPHPASPPSPKGEGKRHEVSFGPGLRDKKYCNACGCDMEAKTKVIDAKCPIGRW